MTTRWLAALLTLAQTSRDRSVDDTLLAVATTVQSVLGYGAVVVNIYRPAEHDYEVVLVLGDSEARAALMHTTNSYAVLHEKLLLPDFERVPGAYLLAGGNPVWDLLETAYTPPTDTGDWRKDDGLVVVLRSMAGEPLGLLSMDQPVSGRRPTDFELEMLVAVSGHAALALDTAQRNQADTRHRAVLTALAGLPAQLTADLSETEVLKRVCAVASDAFGFGSATAFTRQGEWLTPTASVGSAATRISFAAAFAAFEHADSPNAGGCVLVERNWFRKGTARSTRRYRGPASRAWRDDWLLVPLRGPGGLLVGLLVLDEPHDGLRPDPPVEQAARLLADQAVAALAITRQRSELDHQAHHDALTGLRNRRDLEVVLDDLADRADGLAVLLCDLDHFKAVNDRFGHALGDRVLERFGAFLRGHARETDIAVRYGGEEFCLLLPMVDDASARAAAERLRAATPDYLADLVGGQTISIGVATTAVASGGGALLRAADAALYAAKQAGRNSCFAATGADRSERVVTLSHDETRRETWYQA